MRVVPGIGLHGSAHGSASDAHIAVAGKVAGAGSHAAEHGVGIACIEAVGLAGDGVAFVNEGVAVLAAAGIERRERGEAAHAKHGFYVFLADEAAAVADAAPEAEQEARHARRPGPRHGKEGHLLEAQAGVAGGRDGVDLLLADEQRDAVTAGGENFADSNAGKEVAAGAAAGDEHVGGLWRGSVHERIQSWGVQRRPRRITGS